MFLATPIGFEPTISTLTGWRVKPLHHGAALERCSLVMVVEFRRCAKMRTVIAGTRGKCHGHLGW
jgi:hypothetical protein